MATIGSRRPGRRAHGATATRLAFLGPGLTFLTVFMAVPLVLVLVLTVFQRGRYGGVLFVPTVENFTRAVDGTYLRVLVGSLGIATATTALALALGYPTAYAIARLAPRWRTIALVMVVLPFWTNFLIRTYAWIVLLNSEGLLNRGLLALGLTETPIPLLYTPQAVIVGLVYMYLPLMILPLYASIERLDPQLLEASANLGATRWATFRRVTLPLTLPGAITGCLFVFVPSVGNFVIPELLGGGKVVMVGNVIRDQFLKARDWPFGAVLALVVVLMLVGMFLLQAWVSRRIDPGPTP